MTPWRFEGANDPNRENFRIVPAVAPRLFGRRRAGAAAGAGVAAGSGCRGTAGGRRRGRRGSRGRLRLGGRIDPAGVNAAVERLGHLGIDLGAKPGQAAEGRLDMAAGAAEPVVEIEVTKGGVEIVEPHQAHHAAAEPDAFRVSGRAVDGLRRLDEFVGLALIVLGGIGRLGRDSAAGLPDWSWALGVAALGERRFRYRSGVQARRRRGGAKPHSEAEAPLDA